MLISPPSLKLRRTAIALGADAGLQAQDDEGNAGAEVAAHGEFVEPCALCGPGVLIYAALTIGMTWPLAGLPHARHPGRLWRRFPVFHLVGALVGRGRIGRGWVERHILVRRTRSRSRTSEHFLGAGDCKRCRSTR